MTDEKCRFILDLYTLALKEIRAKEEDRWIDGEPSKRDVVAHVQGMIPQMREMLDEIEHRELKMLPHDSHREKFMRWLGFVQGVFYATGVYTVEQMKAHNRPGFERGPELTSKEE